jgi:imidazolonepropionase-like amidohydrolase
MNMVITAAQVLPTPDSPLRDGAVLVTDDRITAVGPRDQVLRQAGPSATRYDYPGATVLAGLFNAHVHLVFDASRDFLDRMQRATPEELRVGAVDRLRQLVRAGVTTVRDLGDRDQLAVSVRSAGVVLPRVLAAGTPLTVPGGHCHFLGGAVANDTETRNLIDANAAAGADVIKVMASGGQITPGGAQMWESQFSLAQLRMIVSHTASHGLPVAAHAHGADAIEACVEAGVATIEHCTWLVGPGETDQRDEVAKRMVARGIAACSTTSPSWRAMAERMGPDVAARVFGRLRWMEDQGVPLIAGTDAGLPSSVFDNPVGALEMYEWLGFPPARILEIATVDSARALGLGNVTGRLAPGYSADLLVVNGDPLTNLAALSKVRRVLARGRLAA